MNPFASLEAISYIPKVYCAKCQKDVTDIQRVSNSRIAWVRVRCHGDEQRIPFANSPTEKLTLWR